MNSHKVLLALALLGVVAAMGSCNQAGDNRGAANATSTMSRASTPRTTGSAPASMQANATSSMPAASQKDEFGLPAACDALVKMIEKSNDVDLKAYVGDLAKEPQKTPREIGTDDFLYTFGHFQIFPSLLGWNMQILEPGGGRRVIGGNFRKDSDGNWVAEEKSRGTFAGN
jgi:hypothetical protein